MKRDPADELHVKMHHVPHQLVVADDCFRAAKPARGVFDDGERLGKQLFERFALFETLHQRGRFCFQLVVGELLKFRLQRVDFANDRFAFADELAMMPPRKNLEDGGYAHG